jgi:hypothetical protein
MALLSANFNVGHLALDKGLALGLTHRYLKSI